MAATAGLENMGKVSKGAVGSHSQSALAAPAPFRSVSQWIPDSNGQSHATVIQHNLGVIPTHVEVFFSADLDTVYPVTWSWSAASSGNPVTIAVNAQAVILNIYNGAPLHGVWNPNTEWTSYSNGYWRVVVEA